MPWSRAASAGLGLEAGPKTGMAVPSQTLQAAKLRRARQAPLLSRGALPQRTPPPSRAGRPALRAGARRCSEARTNEDPQSEETMLKTLFGAVLAGALGIAGAASAQTFPTRPMTLVIPFAAGGPTDVLGRVMAEAMSKSLGQQVVFENVGGAGGGTGSQRVARAAPDGYTFLLGTVGTHAQNQTLYKKPLYNAATDFQPVGLIAEVPLILITRKDFPASSFEEFVACAKANQYKMTYGSAGAGSATHLGCVLLDSAMGTKIQHVPYRGTGPAMQDLQGGRIDFLCEIVSTALQQIQGGAVKAIATMTKARSPVLPELPIIHEKGIPNFEALTWNAFFLPKNTPEPIAKKLHDAMLQAMDTPAVKERLQSLGAVLVAPERRSPEYLAGFVTSEIEKWAAPIKASEVSVE